MHEQNEPQDAGGPSLSQAKDERANPIPHPRRIAEGMIIGVAAGVVVSLFAWLSSALLDENRKLEQINHMRDLVAKGREEFYKPVNPHPVAGPLSIRVLRFKETEAQLRNAIERRSTHVPYDRLYEIESAFRDIEKFERFGPTTNEGISCVTTGRSKVNIQVYEDAFRKLEEALDLPETATDQGNSGQVSDVTVAHMVMCQMAKPVQVVVVGQR